MPGIVVIGAGQAGFQLGSSLRENGYEGPVTLIGEEPNLPYNRPPLSKTYLTQSPDLRGLLLRPASYFADHRIVTRMGERAVEIAPSARTVTLESGERLDYDHLVLATGSRNRVLPVPGADLPGVHQLRTIEDADRLSGALRRARHAVIVGAGFIGLEVAAICSAKGVPVTVLEGLDRPMARSASHPLARAIQAYHAEDGVRFLFNEAVIRIEGTSHVTGVITRKGTKVEADLVLIGIGVVPNQELAAAAGLATGNGIIVDALLETSDSAISAIGDCAAYPSPHAGGALVRIESVQNAVDGARCVAARLTGRPGQHAAVPWFWSHQGKLKIQIAGLTAQHDMAVARGEPQSGYAVFCYHEGRLVGVETLNRPTDHILARQLLHHRLTPAPEQVADPSFDLKSIVKQRSTAS